MQSKDYVLLCYLFSFMESAISNMSNLFNDLISITQEQHVIQCTSFLPLIHNKERYCDLMMMIYPNKCLYFKRKNTCNYQVVSFAKDPFCDH